MPRIQFSDVTPPNNRRSIRDVPIPNGGKRKVPITINSKNIPVSQPKDGPPLAEKKVPVSDFDSKMSAITEKKNSGAYEYYYPKEKPAGEQYKNKKKQWVFGGVILFLVIIFIVGMMTVFASATINITPKNQEISANISIIGANNKIEEGTVKYEVIKLTSSKTVSVPATGEEDVELKSSGKIIVYNNFSSEPQRLIIRTRFESPEGLVYRIPESIVVPGKTEKNGEAVPGSLEVTVFADEAGEKYNISKTDFTIPGFKNDADRYKTFYARSVTDITGGFVGKMKKVSENDKQTDLQNIQSELESELKKDLASKVPEGLTLLSNAITYESKELSPVEESSSVIIGKEVTAYAIMFDTVGLSKKITDEHIVSLEDWINIKPIVVDFSSLNIKNMPENLTTNENLDLEINGKTIVWANIDTDSIKERLLGAPKKEAANLIDEFTGISSITATIRPVWKRSFPKDPFKINVQTITDR